LRRKENSEQGRAMRKAMEARAKQGRADTAYHTRNFLDAVKSRKPASCPVEVGHRSTTAPLLAKMALRRKKYLLWDAKSERVVNEEDSNKLLSYEYRPPWRLS